jgi:MFS family permease
MPVFVLVTAMTTGRLIPVIGSRLFAIAAVLLVMGTIAVVIAFDRSLAAPTLAMIPGLVLQGAGQGFTLPTMLHLTLVDVPPRSAGTASGVYQTMQQLTSSIGVAVLGIVFFGTLNGQTGQAPYAQAFSSTMVFVVGLHIALFAVHFVLPRRFDRVSIDDVDPPDEPMPVKLQPEG